MRINPTEWNNISLAWSSLRTKSIEYVENHDTPDEIVDLLYRLPEKKLQQSGGYLL